MAEREDTLAPPISGADRVVAWFGRWPSLHDAEITGGVERRRLLRDVSHTSPRSIRHMS